MRGDIGLIQDADLEYDPADYPALVAPILEGRADAVFGSRFASAGQRKILLYWHGVANHFLTWLTNILNDINLTDMETCYKAVRADILKQTPLYSDRFGIEPELTTKLAQWNIRLYEVPISYHGRTVAEGKKIGWKDAVSAIWTLDPVPLHRRPVHDPRRLLRAAEHAARARPEPVDPRAVPPLHRQARARGGRAASATSPSCCSTASGWCASTTIRSTSRWPTGASATSRTSGRSRRDLSDPAVYADLKSERIDTIVCLNVLEHIAPDEQVLRAYYDLLEPGRPRHHPRPRAPLALQSRATKRSATSAATRSRSCTPRCRPPGFEVVMMEEFNRMGVPGWWMNKQLGRRDLNPRQMRLFERLLPIAKGMEALKIGRGLSLIGVGRKPA